MSEKQILVPISLLENIVSSVFIAHSPIRQQVQKLLNAHTRNEQAKIFYTKWQGLEQLSADNLKIVVAVIDALDKNAQHHNIERLCKQKLAWVQQ